LIAIFFFLSYQSIAVVSMDSVLDTIAKWGWPAVMTGVAVMAAVRAARAMQNRADRTGPTQSLPAAPGGKSLSECLVEHVEAHYPVHPGFFRGPLAQALEAGRAVDKMLLLYISPAPSPLSSSSSSSSSSSPTFHPEADAFLRDVLCSEYVAELIRENFVSWVGVYNTAETAQMCRMLNIRGGPTICVLRALTSGPQRGKLALLFRCQQVAPADLALRLIETMERKEQEQLATSLQEAEQQSARRLVQEQDAEYAAALEADRKRRENEEEEERKAAEEQRRRMEEEQRMKQEEEARLMVEEEERQRRERLREAKKALVPEEPEAGPGVCSVRLRFPDGSSEQRRFAFEQPLQTIFDFVECHELKNAQGEIIDSPLPNGARAFRLVTSYPRKSLEDPSLTLQQLNLGSKIVLIVEEVVDDEEDED